MPSLPTSKRSACDRCRNMKLRCPPREDKDSTSPCGRCLRLRAHCVTSSGRLFCRPPRDDARTANIISNPDGPESGSRSKLPLNKRFSAPIDTDFDSGDWPGLGVARGQVQCRGQSQVDLLATPTLFSSAIPSAISEDVMPFFEPNHDKLTFGELDLYGIACPKDLTGSAYEDPASTLALTMLPILKAPRVETDYHLASLRINISKQFRQYQGTAITKTFGSAEAPLSGRGGDMDIDQAGSAGPLRFGDALRNISNFLGIIEDYGQETRPTPDHRNGSTCQPVMSIVVVLDILSAYLQIVAIYDDLCAQLYEKLRACSQGFIPGLQILPGLQLGGISVDHGHLQTKILIQVIVYHFEMIERLLGLPLFYRVSGRQDIYMGLLEDERCKKLFSIVMEDEGGSKALSSLRDNFKRIERFINM